LKSGSLNLLEPSESIEACNGIALPIPYYRNNYSVGHKLHFMIAEPNSTAS